jgi:tetratricopeptide (TPR) repeat protein
VEIKLAILSFDRFVAHCQHTQGEYQEAEPVYRKGLEIRQRMLGEEHPDTATSYNNVAMNLNAQGKYEEAEPVFRLAYEILLSTLGDQHPTTKVVYQNWLSVKSKT